MIESFALASYYNRISGLMVIPDAHEKSPCVVLSHGLVSSKESSKYVALSERFVEAGIATCRFDYHGCGESEGNIEDTTLTIRVENLDTVVEYVVGHHCIDRERIGILGSSFGGTTCVLKAARDKKIRCISPWATPYRLEKEGDGSVSGIRFKETLYDDFSKYDVLAEAQKVSNALVVHGEMDDTVPCREGKAIYENMQEPKEWVMIEGGDHIFSNPSDREQAMAVSLSWFRRYLCGL